MRISMLAVSVLVATTTGTVAKARILLMPNQAALACNARAWHEMERQNYSTAEPIKRFKIVKLQDGWCVRGAYLARHDDVEQRFDIACDVGAEGVDLVATVRAD